MTRLRIFSHSLAPTFSLAWLLPPLLSAAILPGEHPALADSLDQSVQHAKSAHFTVFLESGSAPLPRTKDCRQRVATSLCPVKDPMPDDLKGRSCQPGAELYMPAFEGVYDHLPPSLQKVFCSMRHIYIEQDSVGTAYSGLVQNEGGRVTGAIFGIRAGALDSRLPLARWASWKEQLNFGGDPKAPDFPLSNDLPYVKSPDSPKINSFLYFIAAHEMGHLLDFSNDLNKTEDCHAQDGKTASICGFAPGSWGAISWQSTVAVRPEQDFDGRSELCFYLCKGQRISLSRAKSLYANLANSSFISTYAATNPYDDLADSLAYTLLDRQLDAPYEMALGRQLLYDVGVKLKSPSFQEKKAYVDALLARPDLIYPGQEVKPKAFLK